MEKFNRTIRGYDPDEVNAFLDNIINQVEGIISEMRKKDDLIKEKDAVINGFDDEKKELIDKVEHYTRMESTLNQAILMAQKTSEQMKSAAIREGEILVSEAKGNANRIINEALLKSEKIERDAESLKRNIRIFKRRLKDIVESQLEIIDDIEKIEL